MGRALGADSPPTITVLEDAEKTAVLERLVLARKMVDSTDALKWLTSWKTPEERNNNAVC